MNIYLFRIYVFFLYRISDLFYFILFYFIRYRKKVVYFNLKNAFPSYSEKQIVEIQKNFYLNFADWIVEYFILMCISRSNLKYIVEGDISLFKKAHHEGRNFYGLIGHQFNWEFLNIYMSSFHVYEKYGVFYLPPKNKKVDNFIYKLRSKFGAMLINAYHFGREMIKLKNQQHSMGILADQRPFNPENAYWCYFLNQKTPFIKEAEKATLIFNSTPFFVSIIKIKRGKYRILVEELIFDKNKEGDLTKKYAQKLEESIKANPSNYLWSHKRWKNHFNPIKHQNID